VAEQFFDPPKVLHDLLRELKELGNPVYPNKAWHMALALVAREDFFRHVGTLNARADPHPVLLVSYIDDPDPKKLILNGCVRILREPHESQDDRNRRLEKNYKERYRDLLNAQRRIWRRQHREEVAAQQRDYYLRNRERLKAKAKEWRKKHGGLDGEAVTGAQ
jgi:hypothetical protein